MASSFNGRENRRLKVAQIIEECYPNGEWFTMHDIMDEWAKRWRKCLTIREMCRLIPVLGLEWEYRNGENFKSYRYTPRYDEEGNLLPIYQKRTRD